MTQPKRTVENIRQLLFDLQTAYRQSIFHRNSHLANSLPIQLHQEFGSDPKNIESYNGVRVSQYMPSMSYGNMIPDSVAFYPFKQAKECFEKVEINFLEQSVFTAIKGYFEFNLMGRVFIKDNKVFIAPTYETDDMTGLPYYDYHNDIIDLGTTDEYFCTLEIMLENLTHFFKKHDRACYKKEDK